MMQGNLFPPESSWKMPTELPALGDVVAIDTETRDSCLKSLGPGWPFRGLGHVAGISLADHKGTIYLPIGHEGGGNFARKTVLRYLDRELRGKKLVFANAEYDLGWLKAEGLDLLGEDIHDVQIMAPLLDENRFTFALDALARDFLGDKKDEALLMDAAKLLLGLKKKGDVKGSMWRLPPEYVGPYAEQDALVTYNLFFKFLQMLSDENLMPIYDMERKLIPIMLKMRQRGIRVDLDRADKCLRHFKRREKQALQDMKEIVGFHVNQWAAEDLAKAFDSLGIKYNKTEKGNPSFDSEWLGHVDQQYAKLVLEARRFQKAHSTFITNAIFEKEKDGRIHGCFHQLKSEGGGTVTGRFSSSNPNLQQVPARDPEVGPLVRSCFLPEEGESWAAIDFSSQEPRITVHFAESMKAPGAREAGDRYRQDSRTDYHQMVADLCGIDRKSAKTINLGIAYGMQGASLCKRLGLPTEFEKTRTGRVYEKAGQEGEELLRKYHQNAPFIKALDDACQIRAKKRGFVRTLLGRKCRVLKGEHGEFLKVYTALNKLIQGSAGDQTKASILACYDQEGKIPLLTLHDENGFSVSSEEEAQKLGRIMEEAAPLSVPSIVDIEIGASWGESMGHVWKL